MDMLFKEFVHRQPNVTLFIDLDGTLVKSMPLTDVGRFVQVAGLPIELQQKRWQDVGGRTFDWHGERYIVFARPHAKRFLLECQAMAHTCIMTHGSHLFQMRVIDTLGFPIKELYGREDYHRVPRTPYGILVDDLPQIAFDKLAAIGIGPDRFLHIRTWDDADWQDNELMEFIPKIRNMVKQDKHALSIAH